MKQADWFFDVISPFAYLQLEQFNRLPANVKITPVPVLFGAVLDRVGNRGPAEIPGKRLFTYRIAQHRARKRNIPFTMPPQHPFNPLRALRLIIACGGGLSVIQTVMRFIWAEGRDVNAPEQWQELCRRLGVSADESFIQSEAVKARLRDNTERALEIGVFGVPMFHADGEFFWGDDATDMFLDYLADPALFTRPDWARLADLPIGVQRKAAAS